jgi:spore maturation protein A
MNGVFKIVIFFATLLLLFLEPVKIIDSMIMGAEKGVQLMLSLLAVYAVWMSVLELITRLKLDQKLRILLKPLLQKLFGKQTPETENQIAINISSNMLGMGNAATPSGIKAMQGLDKKDGKINKAMILFMVFNASAIQIVPTTIIGLRASAGSSDASSIFLPTLIATLATTVVGVLLVLFIEKIKQRKKG